MIVNQLDHGVFSMETLVQEFQDELGYSFEIYDSEAETYGPPVEIKTISAKAQNNITRMNSEI